MNRSLEDINAEFGDSVAVHYYGATEADEKEYSRALERRGIEGSVARAVDDKAEIERVEEVSKA